MSRTVSSPLLVLALAIAPLLAHCSSSAAPATSDDAGADADDATSDAAGDANDATGDATDAASDADAAPTCAPGDATVFAIRAVSFGQGNSGEWKKVGFDLDGRQSTAASSDVCKPNAGGSAGTAFPDGDQGIDNSFGKNLVPLLAGLLPTFTDDVNRAISSGQTTTLLKVACLPSAGDAAQLSTQILQAAPLGAPPKYDGTDAFPIDPAVLADPADPTSTTATFAGGSVKGDKLDLGLGTFVIAIPFKAGSTAVSMQLHLRGARLTATLAADRKSATVGMVGGVLDAEELVAEMKKVGALANLCSSQLLDSLLTQARQSSDILRDGSQDATKTCDGISIGLGFELAAVKLGAVSAAQPAPQTCP